MPSSFREPKTLSDWIELDYYRRPRRLRRIRTAVIVFVFLVSLGLLAATFWPKYRYLYESRPVSSAHSMFNNNCGVCHVETFQPATRLVHGNSKLRSVGDDVCLSCHDGP